MLIWPAVLYWLTQLSVGGVLRYSFYNSPRLMECTISGIPSNDNERWGIINHIFENPQLWTFFVKKGTFLVSNEHKLLYFSYTAVELLFEVLHFWKADLMDWNKR